MSGYIKLFKLKINEGLQYRAAALSGLLTQFVWGFLLITLYNLLGKTQMSTSDIATYFWLNQAFIALNTLWTMDTSIFMDIENGDVQYSLLKPQNIYIQWFVRNGAHRLSRTLLRCVPLLIIVFFLPQPYTMMLPQNIGFFIGFLFSLLLSLLTQLAVGNIMYALSMITKHSMGVRIIFTSAYDLLDGGNIPHVYFPETIRNVLKYTFFYSIKSAPFLIYMGHLEIFNTILLQLFWVVILIVIGYFILHKQLKRIEVYGG